MNPIRFWLLFLALSAAAIFFAGSNAFAGGQCPPRPKPTLKPRSERRAVKPVGKSNAKPIIKVGVASLELRQK